MRTQDSSLFRGRLIRLAGPRPEDAEILARWSENDEWRAQQAGTLSA